MAAGEDSFTTPRRPRPLRVASDLSSADLAERVGAAIEDVPEAADGERRPFSPSAVAHDLTRLAGEAAHQRDVRAELLSPEARRTLPPPPT